MNNRTEMENRILKMLGENDSDKDNELILEYMNVISRDIMLGIGGINPLSAPFIVVLLEEYAEKIRAMFPDIDLPISDIKKLNSRCIKVVIPRDKT